MMVMLITEWDHSPTSWGERTGQHFDAPLNPAIPPYYVRIPHMDRGRPRIQSSAINLDTSLFEAACFRGKTWKACGLRNKNLERKGRTGGPRHSKAHVDAGEAGYQQLIDAM